MTFLAVPGEHSSVPAPTFPRLDVHLADHPQRTVPKIHLLDSRAWRRRDVRRAEHAYQRDLPARAGLDTVVVQLQGRPPKSAPSSFR